MHIGRGIGMNFIGAGISEVGIAGRVIDNHVNIGIFKGIDHFFRLCVFLQIYRLNRKGFVGLVSFIGSQRHQGLCRFGYHIALFIQFFGSLFKNIIIRAAAQWEFFIVGSVFDYRDIQQLDKLCITHTKGYIQFIISVLRCPLIGGKPAKKTVRADSPVDRITDIFCRNRGSVMEGMGIVDGQNPGCSVFVVFPFRGNAGYDIKVVVNFYNVFINQCTDKLVEMVCSDERIKAVFSVDVQREYTVRCLTHGKVLPFR